MASLPVSPVLILITSSTLVIKILPSPIFSVFADFDITSIIAETLSSFAIISNLIFGRVSIVYSAPRYNSV